MRPLRMIALSCALLLSLVACASIPRTSAVHEISEGDNSTQVPSRYEPAGPADDATPAEIVRGYLDAMLAYPSNLATAKKFLTEDAADAWTPGASTLIYTTVAVLTSDSARSTSADVDASVSVTAQLDKNGHFSGAGGRRSLGFELAKIDGRWRISSAPAGTLISQKYFSDYFRTFNLYFLNADGKRLWAEPVHVSVGEQTATELVKIMLRGPGDGLKEYAHSPLPASTTLSTSIPVDADGVAEVALSADLSSVGSARRNAMAAQLTWTLTQISDIDRVQISGDKGVIAPRGNRQQRQKAWQSFNPVQHSPVSYAISNGVVHELSGSSSAPVDGVWGEKKRNIDAVSVAAGTIAAVNDGEARFGKLSESKTYTVSSSAVSAVEVDDSSAVLVAAGDGDGSKIVKYEGGESHTVLRTDGPIKKLALAPDGARYAIVTGGDENAVAIGLVRRDEDDRITALTSPHRLPSSSSVQAVSWLSGTTLLLAKAGGQGVALEQRTVDGALLSEGGFSATVPADSIQELSVGTNQIVYVLDGSDQLWALRGGASWRSMDGHFVGLSTGS